MNWLKMINGHVMWKQRLLEYMQGTNQEKLDPAEICRDDLCELGKWIHTDGKAYAETPHFPLVKDNHTLFHNFAAQIVELVDAGDLAAAKSLLDGEYAKISRQLQLRLSSMAQEVGKNSA